MDTVTRSPSYSRRPETVDHNRERENMIIDSHVTRILSPILSHHLPGGLQLLSARGGGRGGGGYNY